MFSLAPRPAEFNAGEGLIQDRLPIIKKEMLEGRPDNPNNIVILVGPTEEEFVVNKCLAKISSRRFEKSIKKVCEFNGRLKFPEIVPRSFKTMLECVILEMSWKFTNLQETCDLVETATRFGFYSFVEEVCEWVFQEAQTRENVFDDKKSLEKFLIQCFGFESLREKALENVLQNGPTMLQGNQILQLSLEDFGEILIQDKLKIESEIEVLSAVIRWGMNALKNEGKLISPENLRDVLAAPLNWVRYPNMEEREFRDYVIPLEILTDHQIKAMELWYKSGGSISNFNNHPRNYLKDVAAKPAGNDSKSMGEILHATKMDNLISKFNMNIQLYNAEVEAGNAKTLASALEIKNLELEDKVRRWDKVFKANRFCQTIEAIKKHYESSSTNTDGHQADESDYNLLKMMVDKIHKNEDLSELVGEIEEPDDIDLQLLESVNETIVTKIVELQRVICSEIYEPLSWKIFQKETNSTVVDLQKFPNTQSHACAIIFKNNTPEMLQNFQNFDDECQIYISLLSNIQPFCTHNYGQTNSYHTAGVLSYDIGSMGIVIRHYFHSRNDFGIAIVPSTMPMSDIDGFVTFEQDWTNDSTKIKALCKAPTEMEKCIKLGNLCLHAELIGTGPKAVIRVLLTAL